LAGGYTLERILAAYPDLKPEQVQGALEYAAQVVDEEQVIAGTRRHADPGVGSEHA